MWVTRGFETTTRIICFLLLFSFILSTPDNPHRRHTHTRGQLNIQEVLRYPALGRAELPEIIRAEPLTLEDFNALIATKADKELKIKIFNGGLTPEARPTVWQHIFGVYNDEHLHTG